MSCSQDSEVGCEDILRFYGDRIAAERVAALPFVALARFDSVGAGEVEAVRERHGLKASYLFYPAQLWPHKNHLRIVEAVGRLQADGVPVEVAFTGSPAPGPRAAVHRDLRRRAVELGIEDAVHLLGELPGDEVAPLYAGAVALVMPTFFGPTNIPVLEAWAVGCPVITSDIRGIREQTGDAAMLVDPRSTESIAEGIARVWRDEALRRRLVDAGLARLATWDRAAFANRLEEVLVRAASEASDSKLERMEIERIAAAGETLALLVRASTRPQETTFVTAPEAGQQVGFVVYPAGGEIGRHRHADVHREVTGTGEVLIVREGACEIDLFDREGEHVATCRWPPAT